MGRGWNVLRMVVQSIPKPEKTGSTPANLLEKNG